MRTAAALFLAAAAVALAADKQSEEQATAEGVKYFAGRCKDQQELLKKLGTALKDGDLKASKKAYIASRPPYEEIEVLATAESIGELDGKIDSRPYAMDDGEDDKKWEGFHQIERDLYRDGDVKAATEHLGKLTKSVDELCEVLDEGGDVTKQNSLDGQLALAYELAAKKVSSEEETWSDASLMIFRHNWIGIYSQFKPFKKTSLDSKLSKEVDDAYKNLQKVYNSVDTEGWEAKDGKSRPYSDVTGEERDTLVNKAAYRFADAIKAVHDEIYTKASKEKEDEEEEFDGVIADGAYGDETAETIKSLRAQCTKQQDSLAKLQTAVKSGDLKKARAAYPAARIPYEQIEVVASAFEEEDTSIDARPDAYEFGEKTKADDDGEGEEWRGMHMVERQLYRDDDLEGAEKSLKDVEKAVDSLCKKLDDKKLYGSDEALKGALALSLEVPAKKISSEEESVSDLSLMIFRENSKGIKAIYDPYAPLLSNKTQSSVDSAFSSIREYWESDLDSGNDWDTGTGFAPYSKVDNKQRDGIHKRFYTLHRALKAAQGELGKESPAVAPKKKEEKACFPADARALLPNGDTRRMDELNIGDFVVDAEGAATQVFMWTHKMETGSFDFLSMKTASGKNLEASAGHFVEVNGDIMPAALVKAGDSLRAASGEMEVVSSVSGVSKTGLFNPQTVSGSIVVNGVAASTYTTAVQPAVAHAILAPLRALFAVSGRTTSVFEAASSLVPDFVRAQV